jgi:hypothetical protein
MRNRLNRPKPALCRLAQLLALAALTVGVLPMAAAGADDRTASRDARMGIERRSE